MTYFPTPAPSSESPRSLQLQLHGRSSAGPCSSSSSSSSCSSRSHSSDHSRRADRSAPLWLHLRDKLGGDKITCGESLPPNHSSPRHATLRTVSPTMFLRKMLTRGPGGPGSGPPNGGAKDVKQQRQQQQQQHAIVTVRYSPRANHMLAAGARRGRMRTFQNSQPLAATRAATLAATRSHSQPVQIQFANQNKGRSSV